MSRRRARNRKKQEEKVNVIIKNFLKEYKTKVEAVTIPARSKVLKVVKANVPNEHKRINEITENKTAELSTVNAFHLEVWRGLLVHFKHYYPLVRVNPNYFDGFINWGDPIKIRDKDELFLKAV